MPRCCDDTCLARTARAYLLLFPIDVAYRDSQSMVGIFIFKTRAPRRLTHFEFAEAARACVADASVNMQLGITNDSVDAGGIR